MPSSSVSMGAIVVFVANSFNSRHLENFNLKTRQDSKDTDRNPSQVAYSELLKIHFFNSELEMCCQRTTGILESYRVCYST